MYLSLIFFFISLAGIIIMIGNKLALVRSGQVIEIQHPHPFVPDLQKIKHLTLKGTKKFGYVALFVILRFFIKFSNFIKTNSLILIKRLKDKLKKNKYNTSDEIIEKKEVSKYLRIISEYRHKIKEIKHKIKEEEGIE